MGLREKAETGPERGARWDDCSRPGRDHWPQAQAILVSGACKTGIVVGSTTAKAEVPKDRPLTPNDLWATVFQHLDIDYNHTSFLDGTDFFDCSADCGGCAQRSLSGL